MADTRIGHPVDGDPADRLLAFGKLQIERTMLTIQQKADILRKTGAAVPELPSDVAADAPADTSALREWIAAVNALFVTYAAARAAKSLRDAEEARQGSMLRQMAAMSSRIGASGHAALG